MFALVAAILWFLVACGVGNVGPVSLVWLGAGFYALHFAFDLGFPGIRRTN